MRTTETWVARAAVAMFVATMALANGVAEASEDDAVADGAGDPAPAQGCPMSRTCRYEANDYSGYAAGSCQPGGWNCIGDPCSCEVYLNNAGAFGLVQGTFQP
ncbi:MAG: hypothetical protein U0234_13240 [Sandaracinus sp.]